MQNEAKQNEESTSEEMIHVENRAAGWCAFDIFGVDYTRDNYLRQA